MLLRFRPKSVLSFIGPVLAGYLASIVLLSNQRDPAQSKELPNAADLSAYLEAEEQEREELLYYEQLLADSILSIVKTYYVDPNRIANSALLRLTLESLRENMGFSVTSTGDRHVIKIEGREQSYVSDSALSYEGLLLNLMSLAQFVSTSKGVQEMQKNATASMDSNGMVIVLGAMLVALDAHSALLSAEGYDELRQSTEGSFGGLGVIVGIRDHLLTVIKPLPRSPAERVGIIKRDRILAIDGKETFGLSLNDLVDHMKGSPGSKVKLSLLRDNDLAARDVSMNREIIQVDSLTKRLVQRPFGPLLALSIESFSGRTAEELADALAEYHKTYKGSPKGIILDLRSNPGGLLDQAVKVVDQFVEKGVIVSTKGRREEKEEAHRDPDEERCPMIVLVNEDSASASEIVAGALQDHGRAIIVGQPSFGKGSVQTIFELPHNQALKLTIARYYTPAGRSIQNVGIMPDIWVQPVYRSSTNRNLLGAYRYRSERFLAHHLGTPSLGEKLGSSPVAAASVLWQGFYLTDLPDDFKDEPKLDHEFELATQMFDRMYEVYKGPVPIENSRTSHWLALAAPAINKTIGAWEGEVTSYLQPKHSIDWAKVLPKEAALKVELVPLKDAHVKPGDSLTLNVNISNQGTSDVGRVSVYLRTAQPGLDTEELLVGLIKAGEQRKLVPFSFAIPSYWPAGSLKFELGIAVAGYPMAIEEPKLTIEVDERALAALEVKSHIEEPAGQVAGALEPSEVAALVVELHNPSKLPLRGLTVQTMNLTGRQLELSEQEQKLAELAPQGKSILRFPIQGGSKLVQDHMTIGVTVDSDDLARPYREKVLMKAVSESVNKGQRATNP